MKLSQNCKLLLAMPALTQDIFERSVVLIVHQQKEGILGLILNKKTDINLKSLLSAQPLDQYIKSGSIKTFESINDRRVLFGGPVDHFFMWALHENSHFFKSSQPVSDSLIFSHFSDLIFSAKKQGMPNIAEIGIGVSGWGDEQLQREIRENSWWKLDYNLEELLSLKIETRWEKVLKSLGVDPDSFYDQDVRINQ